MSGNAAYMAPLVILPNVITEPGYYLTRCGDTVHVYAVSARHNFDCFGSYRSGNASGLHDSWHKSGRVFASRETDNDIVAKKEV